MKNGKLLVFLAAAGAACFTPALAHPHISTQAVPGINFSAYKTYTWANTQAPAGVNPVMFQRMTSDFDAALAQHGYVKGPAGSDLSLVLTVGTQDKTDVDTYGWFGMQTSVWQYTQGQLSLDAFDTKTRQALWHGHATETVNPDKPDAGKIDAAVEGLMLKFPATSALSKS